MSKRFDFPNLKTHYMYFKVQVSYGGIAFLILDGNDMWVYRMPIAVFLNLPDFDGSGQTFDELRWWWPPPF